MQINSLHHVLKADANERRWVMKKIIFGLFLIISLLTVCLAQQTEPNQKVTLKAGTMITAQLENIIDAAASNPGDDFTLTTTEEINSAGIKIEKGAVLMGRIGGLKKAAGAADTSEVKLLFDFLKVGTSFIGLKATVILVKRNDQALDLKLAPLPNFAGATSISKKGHDVRLEKLDIFQFKVDEDCSSDN